MFNISQRDPYLLLVATALFWAGNAIAGKYAVGHVSPFMLTALRWVVATAILLPMALPYLKRDAAIIRKHWLFLLLMGGVGYSVFNFFLYTALKHTTAINVAIEQSAMPLFIFIANFLIYRARISPLQALGYSLTVAGVVITATYGDPLALIASGSLGELNRGDVYMLAASLIYGCYSVGLRAKPEMHGVSFFACMVVGALLFAAPGAVFEAAIAESIFPVTRQGWLVVIYAGVFPSLLSQFFFMRGVEVLGANSAGLFINLVPVFAAVMAVVLLGEDFRAYHGLAFFLVVGGVLIAQRKTKA